VLAKSGAGRWCFGSVAAVLELAVRHAAGTFAWAAPEVLTNEKCTEKADIFSFGIVLWEIVTGEQPVRGGRRDVRFVLRLRCMPERSCRLACIVFPSATSLAGLAVGLSCAQPCFTLSCVHPASRWSLPSPELSHSGANEKVLTAGCIHQICRLTALHCTHSSLPTILTAHKTL